MKGIVDKGGGEDGAAEGGKLNDQPPGSPFKGLPFLLTGLFEQGVFGIGLLLDLEAIALVNGDETLEFGRRLSGFRTKGHMNGFNSLV